LFLLTLPLFRRKFEARGGKVFNFNPISLEARQRLINVQQRNMGLRDIVRTLRARYAGTMFWRNIGGREYLYRRVKSVEKSLGPRGPETEQAYKAFQEGRAAAEQRRLGHRSALEEMASGNRVVGLARVPRQVARILRRLDQAGVLGDQICVVGTNALFAYEAISGVQFGSDLLATEDLDIALDGRKSLALAARMVPEGLLGLLKRVDPSFEPLKNTFSAQNASGLMVDLITPAPRDRLKSLPLGMRRLGGASEDIQAIEIPKLEMIVSAPRVSTTAIGEDGLPVWVAAADPRWWAAHKFMLAELEDRSALKRSRDREQAVAVCQMLATCWTEVDLRDEAIFSIPAALRRKLATEIEVARSQEQVPEW
jgi:hypothetical protein